MTGRGLEALALRLEGKREQVEARIVEIMEEVVAETAQERRNALEEAVTPTGVARVASGRGEFEGRHKTGTMVDSIDTDVSVEDDGPNEFTVVGRVGYSDPKQYFAIQEEGRDSYDVPFDGAHAGATAFVAAQQNLRRKLQKLTGRGGGE